MGITSWLIHTPCPPESLTFIMHQEDRTPGYYWIVLKNVPKIGQWLGSSVFGFKGANVWTVHNDLHEYGDDELDAIVPFPLEMDATQAMYALQLAQNKAQQLEYLFNEDNHSAVVKVERNDLDVIISTLKFLRDGF